MGYIEPHAGLLDVPDDEHHLYKIITIENLMKSILGEYLYFNRVDSYCDFKGADPNDGEQLPKDREGNANSPFEKAPSFTAETYYDNSRHRTYACCFSLENTDYIWKNYGRGGKKGKLCLVFKFSKLKETLNKELSNGGLLIGEERCNQIFDINYGIIKYVNKSKEQINLEYSPNPIEYCYMKDHRFKHERELRISLSTLGIGSYVLQHSQLDFPSSLFVRFDFKQAIKDGTIVNILTRSNKIFDCSP